MSVSAVRDWITSRLTGKSVQIGQPERLGKMDESNELKALQNIEQQLKLIKEAVDSNIDATQEVADHVTDCCASLTKAIAEQTAVLKQILAQLGAQPVGPPVALKLTVESIQ